jgi:UDP-glucuronate decarboxylase
MRYLVTGGAGFLGSHLCTRLLNDGHSVLCLDDFSTGSKDNIESLFSNSDFEFVKHDITKPFWPDNIEAIFNLASPASPVHYQYNPIRTLKMGTLAMYNILGMAHRLQIPVLQASTSEVYGDPLVNPQPESYWGNVNPIGPRSCYDEGKRVAESLCVSYKEHAGTQIRIARIFNTYGPHMVANDGRVVCNFIVQALDGNDLTVYGDGLQTRSFCYVSDLVDGLIRLMNSNYQSPVNLGNPSECNMIHLANTVIKFTGKDVGIVHKSLPIDDPKVRRPDISLAKKILDWKPKVSLEEGLKLAISWFEKQK